jgi:rhamnogalacturonyl hydrolase YesR
VPLASAIDYLLGRVDLDPESKHHGYISDGRDQLSRMHGHGFATLALAEAYAMSPKSPRGRRIERALKLAIYRIEISQGAEGGWYYSPLRSLQHEGSVTIALVQALRAARNSGMRVNAEVIAKAVDYVRRSQAEDGSFRYAIGHEMTSVALTAAAISTLNATGIYSGEEVLRGYDYIQRELAARETADIEKFGASYPLYQNLYLAQAYWQHPEHQVFEDWFTRQRAALLRGQDESGAWSSKELAEVKSFGATYATATNALILALPEGLLPIFQR